MVGCLLLGRERAISSCCQLMLPWVFPYPIGNIWQMVAGEIKSSYPSVGQNSCSQDAVAYVEPRVLFLGGHRDNDLWPCGVWYFTHHVTRCYNDMGVSKIEVPQNGWFVMENRMKLDDLVVPLFLETSIAIH